MFSNLILEATSFGYHESLAFLSRKTFSIQNLFSCWSRRFCYNHTSKKKISICNTPSMYFYSILVLFYSPNPYTSPLCICKNDLELLMGAWDDPIPLQCQILSFLLSDLTEILDSLLSILWTSLMPWIVTFLLFLTSLLSNAIYNLQLLFCWVVLYFTKLKMWRTINFNKLRPALFPCITIINTHWKLDRN